MSGIKSILGKLCKNGHDHNQSGQSLRFNNPGRRSDKKCIKCNNLRKIRKKTMIKVSLKTRASNNCEKYPSINGHIYKREILKREFNKANQKKMYGRPYKEGQGTVISLIDVSHLAYNFLINEKGKITCKIQILDTPNGKILKELIKSGNVRFDLSGVGSVNDKKYVQDDYNLTEIQWLINE